MAAWVAAAMGRPVGVICPKVVRPVWERVLAEIGAATRFVVGYEKLRAGNTPHGRWNVKKWEWSTPADSLLIWDEAHRCQGQKSQNARMMLAAKPYHNLLLSATLAADPTEMRACGYLTGLHNWTNFYKWCLRNGCWRGAFGGLEFKKKTAKQHLLALHAYLFPEFGGGLTKDDMAEFFPENHIIAESYDMGDDGAIAKAYASLLDELAAAADQLAAVHVRLKAIQGIELLKVPALCAMAADSVAEGNSVIIFSNYRATLDALRAKLNCGGIYGGQSDQERQAVIDLFQSGASRCIVVNIKAGGVGLSLHDMYGTFPREVLVCPTDNPKDLIQALGRAHRAGGKSRVVQKIVFASGTVEEKICRNVQMKVDRIDLLNEGDLTIENFPAPVLASPQVVVPTKLEPGEARESTPVETSSADKQVKLDGADSRGGENFSKETACAEVKVALTSTPPEASASNRMQHETLLASQPSAIRAADVDHMGERKHARYSPSSLNNKLICPGFENDKEGDSQWADRGTLGHKAVEKNDPSLCGADFALCAAVEKCLAYQKKVAGSIIGYRPPAFMPTEAGVIMEQEIKLSYFDQFGYVDCVFVSYDRAEAIDWKFAVNWYEADSPQFWSYSLGIWNRWPKVETINVHVPHPFRDEVDVHTFTRASDYDRLSAQVLAIIERAKANRVDDYRTSPLCQYCGFISKCPAMAVLGLKLAGRYEPSLELPAGSLHGSEITDPTTIANLHRIAPIVEKAAGGWKKRALDLWDEGTAIPGFEIVEKKGMRSIASARAAYDFVKDKVPVDQYLDACSVSAVALEDLYAAAHGRGDKGEAKKRLNALLTDEEILSTGGGSRYLKAIRK